MSAASRTSWKALPARERPQFFGGMTELQLQMKELFEEGFHSDIQIECRGSIFDLHKNILLPRCEFFRACFQSGFQESEKGLVKLEDDDPDALNVVLRYIYTRDHRAVKTAFEGNDSASFRFLVEVWKTADKYGELELAEQCLTYLSNKSNCNDLMSSSDDWAEEILTCLTAASGLAGSQEGETSWNIREKLRGILVAFTDFSDLSQAGESVLEDEPELTIELLKTMALRSRFRIKMPPCPKSWRPVPSKEAAKRRRIDVDDHDCDLDSDSDYN